MAADVDVVPYLAIGQHQTNMYWAVGGLGQAFPSAICGRPRPISVCPAACRQQHRSLISFAL